ncbi:MIZ zinc finger family protein [Aphelenchoides avenae]|nr:MIZ zinc finger family protein [Aphelenchus avenae]
MKPVLEQRRRNLLLDGRIQRCQVVDAPLKRKAPAISEECSKKSRLRTHSSVQSNLHEQAVQQAKDDSEVVALEPARVSLICPISNKRIQVPVRGENCTHPHCFDRSSFLRLNKKAINSCPFAFCGQKIRADGLVDDVLLNDALRNTTSSVREVELLHGSFKAVQGSEPHDEVVDLDDAPEVTESQLPHGSVADPELSVGADVLQALHAALKSIDIKLEAHNFAYLSEVRASFHDLHNFAQQKFSMLKDNKASSVQLSVARELHKRSTMVFQLAAKQLQKFQDSMNPERPRASTAKQWLHDLAHETVALHSLIKQRVLGAPKQNP